MLGAILTAMATPFDADLRVDEAATARLANHLVEHGSDGLVMAGTTGEASTLTAEEHLRVIELAVQERPSGATIIAGTGSNNTRHAVHLTERATELGADAPGADAGAPTTAEPDVAEGRTRGEPGTVPDA